MIKLKVQDLTKHYANGGLPAVKDLSFELNDGEILALVGPSGCGKTTTLRLIAGLEIPDRGSIFLNDQPIASEQAFVPPEKRGVGMVFQEHALFPHLTVFENVAFGLHQRGKGRRGAIASQYLELVGLADKADRFPHALSGGERQRVALARALAPQPVLLLMDEPFNSLDADRRAQVREQVHSILKSIQATVIFVTHDQEEALQMGDRLAVFRGGMIEQIGEPEAVYHASQTRFVAEFMGESDFLSGETTAQGILTPIGLIPQPADLPLGTQVEIAFRADDIDFIPGDTGNGEIQERFFRGPFYLYRLILDSGQVVHALKPHTERLRTGARVKVFLCAGHDLTVFREGVAVRKIQ